MSEQQAERYSLQKFYMLPMEVLADLMEQYTLEQFIRGFMTLGVLKTNSDYTHVWFMLHDKYGTGLDFDDWYRKVAQPMIDQHPAFEFSGSTIYDYNRNGVVAFKADISEYDVWRLKNCADNRGKWTVSVYFEREDNLNA